MVDVRACSKAGLMAHVTVSLLVEPLDVLKVDGKDGPLAVPLVASLAVLKAAKKVAVKAKLHNYPQRRIRGTTLSSVQLHRITQ